ncbi:MAG TPA: hypothetical protein VGC63_14110 [Solirubrobacterales bacterium]|jgi:hypothetical protein
MTPLEREEMKRRARAKLAAMRERAVRLRKRVLAGAAIGFIVVWAAIFGQMITGNDPALGPVAANVRTAARKSVSSASEQRAPQAAAPPSEEEGEESQLDATRLEEEQVEVAAETERAELEAIEAEELEAVTTGQS